MKRIIRWIRIKIESYVIVIFYLALSKPIIDDMLYSITHPSMFNESNGKFYYEVTESDWRS